MKTEPKTKAQLLDENAELFARLAEAEETLRVIRTGEVDALLVARPEGGHVFTLHGAETIERASAEEALRQSEQEFRSLAETVPQLVWATRPDGWNIYFNQQWVDYTGLTLEESYGHGWNTPFHPDDKPRAWEAWQRATQQLAPYSLECRLRRADGVYRWWLIRGAPMRNAQGGIEKWFGTCTDIEDFKQNEEALRQSEERFRVAQELSPDGFTILRPIRDAQGRVADFTWVYENDAMANMNGTDPKAVGGQRLLELFPAARETQFLKAYQQVAETRERCVFEAHYDAETFPKPIWLRIAVVPIGQDIGVLAQDITQQKDFQAELERLVAQRTAKLQELVTELEHMSYTIVHDMRAPLRAMQAFAEMFAEACVGRQEQDAQRFLQHIRVAANRMDALITDSLNYNEAIRKHLPLAPVDPDMLLRGMLDTYPELQARHVRIQVQPHIPLVFANEAGLTQVFSNLLNNAIKFAKPDHPAEIRIWAELTQLQPAPAPDPLVDPKPTPSAGFTPIPSLPAPSTGSPTRWVRIWVEDNGVGISSEILPRVFNMFTHGSSEQSGTGIGLALARKVVDRMGGRLGVESQEGHGSRFWFELTPA